METSELSEDLKAILAYIKKEHNDALGFSNVGISDIQRALKIGGYVPIKKRVYKLIELGYITKVNSGKGKFKVV